MQIQEMEEHKKVDYIIGNMENTNAQPNSLDPTIVNLAQSIRQQESGGNFQDVGDSGTSKGAYQWQPETWSAESKQYLGADAPASPLDATPEQQNQVAYDKLSDLKKQHPDWNIANMASAWNAGEGNPNAYQDTNQTHGNTPAYAKAVASNYQALKSGQPMTTGKAGATDTTAQTSGMPTWEKIALGIPLVAGGAALALGTGGAAVPEEAAAVGAAADAGEITGGAGSGILSEAGNGALNTVKGLVTNPVGTLLKATGIAGLGETALSDIKGVLGIGNNSSTTDANGEEAATEQAGQTEANATTQASEAQTNEEQLQQDQQEAETQNQLEQEKNTQDALNNTLSSTPTGKVLAQQPQTQETLQTMARNGYVPDTSSGVDNYGYKSNSGAYKKSWNDVGDISEGTEQILGIEGAKGDIESTRQKAHKQIESTMPQPQWEEAKANVDEVINSGNKDFGNGDGSMNLDKMERLKRDYGQLAGKWDATLPTAKRGAYKALNRAFRDEISNKTKHKDLYNRAMKAEQNIFDAQKVMKHREGKKSLEHKGLVRGILKSYGKYVGTAIGDKIGGVFGAIVGTMVGDHLTKAVDKRFGKTYFESKEGKKLIELASKKSPAMAKILKNELKKYGVKAEEMKQEEIKKAHQGYQEEQTKNKTKKGILKQDSQKKRKGFIPSNEWQEVPKGTTLPNGLTFKMDMKTGKNYARKS